VENQKRVQATKMRVLQLSQLMEEQEEADQDGFLAKTAARVLNNIQLTVENVHIRYQDDQTSGQFAFGVTLERLHAVTTDKFWNNTCFTSEESPMLYKRINVQNLALYWNPHSAAPSIRSQLDLKEFLECQVGIIHIWPE
jgi:vacuolar protein sorting-associated protein 13A/C